MHRRLKNMKTHKRLEVMFNMLSALFATFFGEEDLNKLLELHKVDFEIIKEKDKK